MKGLIAAAAVAALFSTSAIAHERFSPDSYLHFYPKYQPLPRSAYPQNASPAAIAQNEAVRRKIAGTPGLVYCSRGLINTANGHCLGEANVDGNASGGPGSGAAGGGGGGGGSGAGAGGGGGGGGGAGAW